MVINSDSFLGAPLVVEDLLLSVPVFGTEVNARQAICGLLLASRYHLLVPFWLNRFHTNNQYSREEAFFTPLKRKGKVQPRHVERSARGSKINLKKASIPSFPFQFFWGPPRTWQSRNAMDPARCSA